MPSAEFERVLEMMAARASDDVLSVAERRAGMEEMSGFFPLAEDIILEPLNIGSMAVEWVSAPDVSPERIILYLHGGGYVLGSINTHREMVSHISRACEARVLMIDYRLAPEYPYPACIEDAKQAYDWLLDMGASSKDIVIAGDSAGGGLTMATLISLKSEGRPMPAAGVLLSPWVDLEGTGASMTGKAGVDPIVQKEGLLEMAGLYLNGADPAGPLASPVGADLTDLPPLLIQVGSAETLLDDSTRLEEKAVECGVDVTLDVFEDMIHVWQVFASMLPEAREAIDRIGLFVREHTP